MAIEKDTNIKKSPSSPISREELYELAWQKPMVEVAKLFGVSSSYMARVCAALNVPTPPVGYWRKYEYSEAPNPPALPTAEPGTLAVWQPGTSLSSSERKDSKLNNGTGTNEAREAAVPTRIHPLLKDLESQFEQEPEAGDALLRAKNTCIVDFTCTLHGLATCVQFAAELFAAIEGRGHLVLLAPKSVARDMSNARQHEFGSLGRGCRNWTPERPTVAYIKGTVIGLAIVELVSAAQECDRMVALYAFGTAQSHRWSCNWRNDIQVSRIVAALEKAAEMLSAREEIEGPSASTRNSQRSQAAERRRKGEDGSSNQLATQSLKDAIHVWSASRSITDFFSAVEQAASELTEDQRLRLAVKVDAARALLNTSSALEVLQQWESAST
jgi:hypothetical protein